LLPVSELIELARGGSSSDELQARAPRRFTSVGFDTPVVIWNICMHCNMSCPHCYAAAVSKPSPTDLSPEEGLRLLEDLAGCGVKIVIFSGGEPLLRPDLFDLLRHAKSLGLSPQLSSNGVYIDAETAANLKAAGVAYVGVSIDGIESFNDDYRAWEGGYKAALEGLLNARAAGMKTGMRMTLSQRNLDQWDEMVGVAESAGIDRFYVSHLVYSGRGFKVAHEDLSRAEVRVVLNGLFERAEALLERGSGLRIVTGSNDSDGVMLLRWIAARYGEPAASQVRELLLQRGGNSAGERVLNIDSRGRVHPDQFWRAAVLGDVREEPISKILEHPLRDQLKRRLDYLKGRCGACTERKICRGSHRERALAYYRDAWAPDPACVMEDAEIGIDDATAAEFVPR
jgi:radical SAM protein with 4Fe4S-binding SPASM domain